MKTGEAHRTQSSSLYSANTIGAPMHPAPIGVADRTGKKILLAHCAWSALPIGGGGHRCAKYWRTEAHLRQYIGTPMSPAPIGNADQAQCANNFFFVFGPPLLLVQGASVRQ